MKPALPFVILLLAGCSGEAIAPHDGPEVLMDRIEATISLPERARPLYAYGRYYASLPEGRVWAVYLVPPPRPDPGASCWTGGGPCNKQQREAVYRRVLSDYNRYLKPGERRWFDDIGQIPQIMDGGCSQVTIQYDIGAVEFVHIGCNGRG